jgi:hypothetical protein
MNLQVKEHLVPWLANVNTRTQTSASLVMIAAHVVLHSPPGPVQQEMLRLLFPATLPYLTSHHHNLRTFTQVRMPSEVARSRRNFWVAKSHSFLQPLHLHRGKNPNKSA